MFKQIGRDNRLLMAALFIWALGEGLWYNLRPLYLDSLGASPAQIGTALAVEGFTRALLPLPAGYLSDRVGPYWVLVGSWVLGIVGVVAIALVTTWQLATLGFMLYAMSAFAIPVISAYALLAIPDRAVPGIAGRTLTSVYASYPAGLIISPMLGGRLADRYGLRTDMWIAMALFVLSLAFVLLLRNMRSAHQAAVPHPLKLLANRAYLRLAVYYSCTMLLLQISYALLPNYLQNVRLFSLSAIGIFLSLQGAGTVISNLLAGRSSPAWNYVGVVAMLWVAVGLLLVDGSRLGVGVAMFMMGGYYTTRALAVAGVARVVEESQHGLAFGTLESLFSFAMALAGQGAGLLYDQTASHTLPLVAGLIGLPIIAGLWFAVRPPRTPLPQPVEALAPGGE
jgi:predicted MFS family arabinose efflux permease